jgi:hypothetical protein
MIHARAGSIRLATGNSFVGGFDAHATEPGAVAPSILASASAGAFLEGLGRIALSASSPQF